MTSRVGSKTPSQRENISRLQRLKCAISASWHRSQIGHRSQYSIERLLSFRDYHERTSLARVLAVCVFAPLPALLSALAIDCIPLKPPSDGWQANYAVWIRLLLAMSTEAIGVGFQVRAVIEPGTISIIGAVKIAIGTATCSVLVAILLAAVWTFPTPFGYVLVVGPFVIFFSIFTVLVVGPRKLTQSPTLRNQFKDQLTIIASQGVVVVCYPIFSAVFNQLPGIQQTIFIFVMPLIKFCTKQNIASAAKSYHEYVGPVVVFSVDLFNVYYVAICMQASKSIVTTLIIMATDSFHVVLALRAIFHPGSSIRPHHGSIVDHYLQDVPELLRTLYNGEGPSTQQNRRLRLFAPFPLPLSQSSTKFMDEMSKTGRFASDKATNRRCSSRAAPKRNSGAPNRVFSTPMPTITSLKQLQISPDIKSESGGNSSYREEVAEDALQALFHSEYILLAEYVEFIVPMLYSLYLAVLFHLPVAAYYPHTASITEQRLKTTVMNIMIYGVIEFVSFGALLVLLRRKFGFSPLYQLAFVLETHAPALQGHLFVWTITILHLTLKHYGVDFNILAT